ncbi:hypothetical protein [uncultured Sutterella sp.]|nr:hypothetical protein [uncultured Sutterella sp.]
MDAYNGTSFEGASPQGRFFMTYVVIAVIDALYAKYLKKVGVDDEYDEIDGYPDNFIASLVRLQTLGVVQD